MKHSPPPPGPSVSHKSGLSSADVPLKSRNARVGFEAPVSYENTWEGMKVGGGRKGGGPSARVKHPHTYEGRRADRHLL